jgi:2-polyprenyl-6-methoxyphenol hydroxylase-like FAD-dependent oxidoreductase
MTRRVVVCGAGAAGLAVACALGRLGIEVLLLEKRPRPAPVAKGELLQPGSLRILREWGVAERLTAAGAVRLGRLVVRDVAGTPQVDLNYGDLPAADRWLLAHDYSTILETLTASVPSTVEVRRGVLVEALLCTDGRVCGVRADQEDIPAALVVAADGLSSRLRGDAGIAVTRSDYPHRLLALELQDVPEVERDLSAYVTDRGLRLRYPLPSGRVRLYAQVGKHELRGVDSEGLTKWTDRLVTETPALKPLTDAIRVALPRRQVLPVSRFLAPRLEVPGLALVGEAGHAVHPMVAQGMNSTIADAHWLATVLRQGGSLAPSVVDHALRRYTEERLVDLKHIGRTSHNAARMITDLSPAGMLLGRRALRCTGANRRISYTIMHTMAGLGVHPLTPLDRLHQIGLLPDPRARRLPAWA